MRTNTKILKELAQFLNNSVNAHADKITLKSLYNDIQDSRFNNTFLSASDPLIIKYTKKALKPADIKKYYNENNSNVLYFVTKIKNKSCCAVYYCYCYDGEKTKEKRIFDFCYWAYDTEAKNRADAVTTIIITQDKKYYQAMSEKRQTRYNILSYYNTSNKNSRYIFKKDFFNEYSKPEEQQRYKYVLKGFERKKELVSNMLLCNKYRFNFNNTYYNPKYETIEIDKSGYILTYKRKNLKNQAIELKEKRLTKAFNNNKQEKYLTILQDTKNKLEQAILKAYQKASKTSITNVLLLNKLYSDRLKDKIEKLERYINKLQLKNYTYNIIDFENSLLKTINFNLLDIITEYNIFLNYDTIYRKIENSVNYTCFNELLKQYNYDTCYTCCVNCYNEQKHIIKNNKLYFLNDSIDIKNYYSFINTPDEV